MSETQERCAARLQSRSSRGRQISAQLQREYCRVPVSAQLNRADPVPLWVTSTHASLGVRVTAAWVGLWLALPFFLSTQFVRAGQGSVSPAQEPQAHVSACVTMRPHGCACIHACVQLHASTCAHTHTRTHTHKHTHCCCTTGEL